VRGGVSYQQAIADDKVQAPPDIRQAFPLIIDKPITRDRYISESFHRREVMGLWPHVWQFACREEELVEAGDIVVYEIAGSSFLIVRGNDHRIRAFRNTCLHRGTKLCTTDTSVGQLKCPFHGFTWSLEGDLTYIPSRWDFPHLSNEAARLREVRIDTWGGFVFINPDKNAPPLLDYLEVIPQHFSGFMDYKNKYIAARFRKRLPCNWKLGIEAFIEAYHSLETHPQVVPFSTDENAQYDVLGRHVSRFLIATGMASGQVAETLSQQAIFDAMFSAGGAKDVPRVPSGMTARQFSAQLTRQNATASTQRDYSSCSDAEAIDANQYSIFPNMVLFRSLSLPVVYRFRPNGHDPHTCIFDLYFMRDVPANAEQPPPAEVQEVGAFEEAMRDFSVFLGRVYDQDTQNVGLQQSGLTGSENEPLLMSREMETRIRHLEQVIDEYLDEFAPPAGR
jgi:phenylpropionate dioxygenase-like ring-hydroxylating dioxygenase large terminal subunit